MTIQDWRSELFSLFQKMRDHSTWPDNYNNALEWMDEDSVEYLKELKELDEKGLFK